MKIKKFFAACTLIVLSGLGTVTAQYTGICCQRSSGYCVHQNGMVFEDATWISGSSTCTGHEEQQLN